MRITTDSDSHPIGRRPVLNGSFLAVLLSHCQSSRFPLHMPIICGFQHKGFTRERTLLQFPLLSSVTLRLGCRFVTTTNRYKNIFKINHPIKFRWNLLIAVRSVCSSVTNLNVIPRSMSISYYSIPCDTFVPSIAGAAGIKMRPDRSAALSAILASISVTSWIIQWLHSQVCTHTEGTPSSLLGLV